MKTKLSLLIIIMILSISSFLFYWFQWRPSNIRMSCSEEALNSFKDVRPAADTDLYRNNFYRECLTTHGLKPESLYVNLQ